jgi:hypothetical protein
MNRRAVKVSRLSAWFYRDGPDSPSKDLQSDNDKFIEGARPLKPRLAGSQNIH